MDTAPNLTPILGRYFQREWSHGEGHRLYDTSGKAYLDFANGIAVTALGHGHPKVNAAIHAQVDRIVGPINAVGFAEPVSRLAGELAATFPDPLDSVLFLNSGSEAIDAALKLCRRVTGRPGIIAFRGGFHGRTFGATSVTTSSLNYRTGYDPLLPGVHIAPFPVAYPDFDGDEEAASAAALAGLRALFEAVIPPTSVGSIVIEPVLGEGGYNPAPASFLQELRALCDEHGILLIADEVQTGIGRTGKMWGFEHAGDRARRRVRGQGDRERAAAGGAGLEPLAPGALGQERPRLDVRREPGSVRGRTGSPRGDPRGAARRERRGTWSRAARRAGADRGRGRSGRRRPRTRADGRRRAGAITLTAAEPDGDLADRVMAACADAGLLVLLCGRQHQVVRWIPPLNVTAAEIAEGVEIFGESLASMPRD